MANDDGADAVAPALGEFAARIRYDALPSDVRDAIKLRMLDQLGAALAGHEAGTARKLLPILGSAQDGATYWGTGGRGGPRDAALFNSFMSHACYMEDGSRYTGGHAACVVIPPAFVLAERLHASGQELIAALAAGYEVFLRLGRAMYPSIVKRGFQSTAVLGGVSSAAACARLLQLSEDAAGHAISLGAMTSVGFKESVKSTASQPFQVGRAAEGGLTAALLAQGGSQGAARIIEQGMFRGFADGVDAAPVLSGLGKRYSIAETYMKRHGGCRGNHAPIDVTESLVKEHGVRLGSIVRLAIRVDTVTFAEDIRQPRDGLQALQSIAFATAVNLVRGDASAHRHSDDNLRDPAIRSLMDRIDVAPDAGLDDGFPDRRPAVAAFTLADGRVLEGRIELARGEPENPMTAEEVRRKFFSLASRVIPSQQAQDLFTLVDNLENLADVSPIAPLMVAPR